MAVTAGGTIYQKIFADDKPPEFWDEKAAATFRVQVLNSRTFHKLTGIRPPKGPISSEFYESIGLPYYDESHQNTDLDTVTHDKLTVANSLKPRKSPRRRRASRKSRAPKIVATTEPAHSERTYDPLQAIDEVLNLDPKEK